MLTIYIKQTLPLLSTVNRNYFDLFFYFLSIAILLSFLSIKIA
ncbi:hypothetical protein HMPREF3187_00381 [Aerococcus christensenii]|uniref:Uncharacterized protein n=1 Tax=Aerococcus christensenii TaxID=87541 RepID=A0A133Y3P5_9LACT|nr:hypothetical protein HMPREF3187_00381 [Aerococcus christensenii]